MLLNFSADYDSIAIYIYNKISNSAMSHKTVINNLANYQDIFPKVSSSSI